MLSTIYARWLDFFFFNSHPNEELHEKYYVGSRCFPKFQNCNEEGDAPDFLVVLFLGKLGRKEKWTFILWRASAWGTVLWSNIKPLKTEVYHGNADRSLPGEGLAGDTIIPSKVPKHSGDSARRVELSSRPCWLTTNQDLIGACSLLRLQYRCDPLS